MHKWFRVEVHRLTYGPQSGGGARAVVTWTELQRDVRRRSTELCRLGSVIRLQDLRMHCAGCRRVFASRRKLLRHVRTVHKAREHPCPVCPKDFARADHLRRHLARCHPVPTAPVGDSPDVTLLHRGEESEPWWGRQRHLSLKPGQLVPWTKASNVLVLAPAAITGIEVPSWWTESMARRQAGMTEAHVAALEGYTTPELDRQLDLARKARDLLHEKVGTPEPLICLDSDDNCLDDTSMDASSEGSMFVWDSDVADDMLS